MDQPAQQQGVHQQAAAHTPPGWYPDPYVPGGERYWDGIAWSPQFARQPGQAAQQQQYQQQHQQQYPQQAAYGQPAAYGQQTGPAFAAAQPADTTGGGIGIVWMLIGGALLIWRTVFTAHSWGKYSGAYGSGFMVGTIVGSVLIGTIFVFGAMRMMLARKVSFGEALPWGAAAGSVSIAIGVALSV